MADVFVDLLYRGLALGSRVRLGEVSEARGYLEVPAPMPVGTVVSMVTGDEAAGTVPVKVLEVVEQTAGSERPPGMVVRPILQGDAALAWWRRLGGDSAGSQAPRPVVAAPASSPAVAPPAPAVAAPLAEAPPVAAPPAEAAPVAAPVAAPTAEAALVAAPVAAPTAEAALVAAPVAAVPDAPAVPDAASALERAGVVSAVLDDQPTMPTEVAVGSTTPADDLDAGDAPSADDPEGAEAQAGDSAELARAEGDEVPEPPSVAGAAPRGRKRRRNRR